jgi:hypothetical protein
MVGRIHTCVLALALLVGATAVAGCHRTDLSKNLTVTPILTGYYDAGLMDGWNHLLPQITFKLKDTGTENVSAGVRITVSYWFNGDNDGENDSTVLLHGVEATLTPGAETGELTARAEHGFRLEGARADFFQHSLFKDMTAKIFVQSGGTIYPLGSFPIERQIIPHASGHP